ncbi:hypothetical protein IC235_10755 [Hymenobacter sp. BT664]|uniref:Beta-Casp domain-containing protein n=1 Tax=Hymenobacter montanus TaxID=2771359 RepID=A0A927BE86_9BACT|nr:hypothetical protein [Hymenobacter montanus]MBD2768373.1 hypothetical protein [Hymenobacter montanus]
MNVNRQHLKKLLAAGHIPPVPVFVGSLMALRVAGLYPRHPTVHQLGHGNVLDFSEPPLVTEVEQSKALNDRMGRCIIISTNGMYTGRRIVLHLPYRLSRPLDTLLIGYQAEGTRGRRLLVGEKPSKCSAKWDPCVATSSSSTDSQLTPTARNCCSGSTSLSPRPGERSWCTANRRPLTTWPPPCACVTGPTWKCPNTCRSSACSKAVIYPALIC